MANQSITIKFADVPKSNVASFLALYLIRGAYIDGNLYTDGFGFTVDVTDENKSDILSLVGKHDLINDPIGFQTLCVGSNFRPLGAPENTKVDGAGDLDKVEQGVRGGTYDWEGRDLTVHCTNAFNRDGGYFWGQASLTVNEQFKIDIDFEPNPEGYLTPKIDFHGLTAVDITTKVVRLTDRSAAIIITTYAGGKSVESAFCC